MLPGLPDLTIDVLRAWQRGNRNSRDEIALATVSGVIGGAMFLLADAYILQPAFKAIGGVLFATSAIALTVVAALQRSIKQEQAEVRVQQIEQRFRDNPSEPQAAWELARVKLETYLDRNLNQVRSIFWLTLAVMGVGFALIFYGVVNVLADPKTL